MTSIEVHIGTAITPSASVDKSGAKQTAARA
jgi:hypothetical protein